MQWNTLVHSVDQWNFTNQSILLHRYYGNAEVIIPWLQDIRHEFTIKKNLTQRAQNILRKAELKLIKIKNNVSHINNEDSTSITYIGVHVRRTDYRAHLWRARRDDPAWCHKHLGKHRNVYIVSKLDSTNSPEQDFAVMAACNHSIIDYGTFGVWGAILAGGETIVHNITGWISTEVGELLPTWHLL
ncbi:galactoside alpha-(1,2)-fucosyltransferase 2-like [Chrysoperla carnea]|uniref:galactoside alpha-(1,2)-fucosyltransferase 2-like n=1 Tax=Chrysoperla carnea TaxID=189513 RepID=UPI001D078813|nr:galactoside alpha-(1,2)-fucosyltransferase 2-like [Chrysoperla carnea]